MILLKMEGGGGEERGRRMNMVQIMCTHICKCKMIYAKTVLGITGGAEEQ
jgi:hypothetical protein